MDLKSLDPQALEAYVASLGEPAYRARQVMSWLYARDVPDPAAWTDLPAALRERLAAKATVTVLEEVSRQRSARDGTTKFLWRLPDGLTVEGVGLPEGSRVSACVSVQVGCAMGCAFCATGRGGFVRDLTTGEIVDQVLRVRAAMGRVSNVVLMGQGEPFRDYDSVLPAMRLMNAPNGIGIGARRITVSTCGVVPGIERLAGEPEQFGLAVSLHSARQEVRDKLMPAAGRWSLPQLKKACATYSRRTGRRVTFEYALMGGVNDSPEDLDALVAFLRNVPALVNLIPVNPVEGSGFTKPGRETAQHFRRALMSAGIEASIRVERGADIDAACGQLKARHES
jgi:23S rRNA (adenine2503-C2)-methyltransferase